MVKASTCGRPRRLTDSQIAEILSWYRSKVSAASIAARFRISKSTLERICRSNGRCYKQPSPEDREENLRLTQLVRELA